MTSERLIPLSEARRRRATAENVPADSVITEDAAALLFAEKHAGQLLYDHDAGAWFVWSGSHWQREKTGLAFDWARTLARDLSKNESGKSRSRRGANGRHAGAGPCHRRRCRYGLYRGARPTGGGMQRGDLCSDLLLVRVDLVRSNTAGFGHHTISADTVLTAAPSLTGYTWSDSLCGDYPA